MQKKVISVLAVLIAVVLVILGVNSQTGNEETAVKEWGGDVYERSYSPSFGPADAKVTIVEFFDPACEACRAFYPFVKEILQRHPKDVRLVLRFAAFHQGSDTVIRMLEIARQQDKFLPVLEALLKDQSEWASHHNPSIDRAWELAEAAGLNVKLAKAEIKSARLDSILQQENADIRSLQIRQTPTFFVNNKPLEDFGAQQLYELVVSEIKGDS